MIEEAYVSFEAAKLLREKGFDEPCRTYYQDEKFVNDVCVQYYQWNSKSLFGFISAPTHQMAMAWLMEVYNIYIEIYVIKNYDKKICEYTYTIMDLNFPGSDDGIDCCNKYKTHKQACEVAIKYCLENLI